MAARCLGFSIVCGVLGGSLCLFVGLGQPNRPSVATLASPIYLERRDTRVFTSPSWSAVITAAIEQSCDRLFHQA